MKKHYLLDVNCVVLKKYNKVFFICFYKYIIAPIPRSVYIVFPIFIPLLFFVKCNVFLKLFCLLISHLHHWVFVRDPEKNNFADEWRSRLSKAIVFHRNTLFLNWNKLVLSPKYFPAQTYSVKSRIEWFAQTKALFCIWNTIFVN